MNGTGKTIQAALLSVRLFRAFNMWVAIVAELKQGAQHSELPNLSSNQPPMFLQRSWWREGGRMGRKG